MRELKVYFGQDLLPYKDREHQVHFPIVGNAFQGASQTDIIKFYIGEIALNDSAVWVACAKLPTGELGYNLLDTRGNDDDGSYVQLTLTRWHTQYQGNLYICLHCYSGGIELEEDEETGLLSPVGEPVIRVTGGIKMNIAYATGIVSGDEVQTHTLEELWAKFGEYLRLDDNHYFKVLNVITDINNELYKDYIENTDIVLAKPTIGDTNYSLYKISGTYPNFTYSMLGIQISALTVNNIIANQVNVPTFADIKRGDSKTLSTYIEEEINEVAQTKIDKTSSANQVYGTDVSGNQTTIPYFTGAINNALVKRKYNGQITVLMQPIENTDAASKKYVDNKVAEFAQNEMQVVSVLPASGEEGIIYLLPIDPTDLTKGYYRYIWEKVGGTYQWLSLGTTEVDLSDFVTTSELASGLATKQDVIDSEHKLDSDLIDDTNQTNKFVTDIEKTTWNAKQDALVSGTNIKTLNGTSLLGSGDITYDNALNGSSTNAPQTKVVYEELQNIREIIEGKKSAFILSTQDTIASVKEYYQNHSGEQFLVFNETTGEYDDKTTELLNGTYDNISNYNDDFGGLVQNEPLVIPLGSYIIFRYTSGTSQGYFMYAHTTSVGQLHPMFRVGDVIYVVETNVPDRWVGANRNNMSFYPLEAKTNLNNYVDLTSAQTISGAKTFGNTIISQTIRPSTNGNYTLGTSTIKYSYTFTNYVSDGNYSADVGELYSKTYGLFFDSTSYTEKLDPFVIARITLTTNATIGLVAVAQTLLPEYKGIITNSGASSIDVTFTDVTNIKCNDDNIIIASNVLTLPAGVTIEVNVFNGNMIAYNWSAQ